MTIGRQFTDLAQQIDQRNLCGLEGCSNKATSLYSWPKMLPVPLCSECKQVIEMQVAKMNAGEIKPFSRNQWVAWLQEHAKKTILERRS